MAQRIDVSDKKKIFDELFVKIALRYAILMNAQLVPT